MKQKLKYVFYFIVMLSAIAALGWIVMSLWNWIIPSVFANALPIDYFRALGLLVLCRVLFGGFHGRGGWHHHKHMQRWHKMTDEEKEKFKRGMMGFHSHSRE
jgi:hypothetical protein